MRKTGTFRVVWPDGSVRTMSYSEYYRHLTEDDKKMLYEAYRNGEVKCFCGCKEDDSLELSITSNYVVRVRDNGNQRNHAVDCPKSILYGTFVENANQGIFINQDMQYSFPLHLPSLYPAKNTSTSKSASSDGPKTHRTNLLDIARLLNYYALEKQTFSIKKKIKNREEWDYKSAEDMIRQMYACSNDIQCSIDGEFIPFSNVVYHPKKYLACEDYTRQFWFFAPILEIKKPKPERKYQYITLSMLGPKGGNKCTMRVPTEKFSKLFMSEGELLELPEDCTLCLTGYFTRKYYPADEEKGKPESDWMQLLKARLCIITKDHGIMVDSVQERAAAEYLCDRHILFTKPLFPIPSAFGDEDVPNFRIGRKSEKDILLCLVSNQGYAKKSIYSGDSNEEYQVLLVQKKKDSEDFMGELVEALGRV